MHAVVLLLAALAPAAPISQSAGFDVDAVGVSALERAAIVERARAELASAGVDLVDAPGLVACADEQSAEANARPTPQECARATLESAGAVAGASVRVVKVLAVVRVELAVLDRSGAVVARSSRTLDIEGAAKGPLFDDVARDALAALAPRPASAAAPAPEPPSTGAPAPAEGAASWRPMGAMVAGVLGGALALAGGGVAVSEALVANSPSSSGDDKERARVLGPVAVGVAAVGVAAAVAAPLVIMLGEP